MQVTIQAADASSAYPDLTFSLNGQNYVLSSGGTITLPYPIYAGDYQLQYLHI